ncbi:probable F-box protein At4g22030 [Macadamia integrifolia]|uniref:probable F-box protein At4g22030 n=1 Tax=Macadamia integrifolia TaxID=60698 RepID=UPI001C4E5756|nr:probable F-box protein At4g22030 [Macadamia integrifolia]
MLDKFPATVDPTVWWPQGPQQKGLDGSNRGRKGSNGWNAKLEEEMRQKALKRKDYTEEYVRLSRTNALAAIVNTMEYGGQVGMVFEMCRSNTGFFRLMEESFGSMLMEREVEKRENGELIEMKEALQLGRSLSELRDLAASSSSSSSSKSYGETTEEFASKLF